LSRVPFARPVPSRGPLPLFSVEGHRLTRFRPPFRFTSFFAPEDTLLCVLAAETALLRVTADPTNEGEGDARALRIVELTAGSGLVGFRLLDAARNATLLGVDVDEDAPPVAAANAEVLGLASRARFTQASVWSPELERELAAAPADVLVCNPPYIPEPPGESLPLEAGAGPDGAAHLRRALELAERTGPAALALSFCSLADPVGVVREAERIGYALEALYAVVIPDGEYSGTVYEYLRELPTAYLCEAPETMAAIAPDGSARFAYLLLAGAFRAGARPPAPGATSEGWVPDPVLGAGAGESVSSALERLLEDFAERGLVALDVPEMPCPVSSWLLDRWDEVALRAIVHGPLYATPPGASVIEHSPFSSV